MAKCRLCKIDLSVYGQAGGDCPDCRQALRNVKIPCAGQCKSSYPIQFMDVVKVVLNPSKKGGKTYKLYYCSRCFVPVKGKMKNTVEIQEKSVKKLELRLKGRKKK
jgi:predicted transcriptional regulator